MDEISPWPLYQKAAIYPLRHLIAFWIDPFRVIEYPKNVFDLGLFRFVTIIYSHKHVHQLKQVSAQPGNHCSVTCVCCYLQKTSRNCNIAAVDTAIELDILVCR